MSATIVRLPRRSEDDAAVELARSVDALTSVIAQTTSLSEAYALWRRITGMEQELAHLADLAGAKCDALLERM